MFLIDADGCAQQPNAIFETVVARNSSVNAQALTHQKDHSRARVPNNGSILKNTPYSSEDEYGVFTWLLQLDLNQ
ncbi:hypothetical protein CQ010_01030 [Arthrobacter sp. MYb211]|uniref:hypothetical protein n=1 Tax=unclassified Glutamicibacter TaxID=2627139 RepID=UPI000BB7DAB2|nr:hypothetical protein [Glutamicibacter sp. BW80]PRA02465.1 hypothetical protein CQ019_13465 [Arthrobacter sp. MYb229]PRA13258.1 hypothetical protein CQ015_03285 [Arthrobacter sp. MYb221]PRB50592.1 hypothetical protein CQ013_11360 [Arthrobacter sp. MYb216]PRC10454.1 hypothetical protein CQ010_01030 [Arthrobacter sp. MYb211]PCC27918.1 hypothetical protein CIK76_13685 [Glutamicibacter sp. BW80]